MRSTMSRSRSGASRVFPPTTQMFLSPPSDSTNSGTLPQTGMKPSRDSGLWVKT